MATTANDLGYHQDWAWIRQIPDKVVRWFESGDLVPLLIVVSAVHYAAVLKGKDQWLVAIAIGLLVDLGHYRWVRAAARYPGGKTGQMVVRWTFAMIMTGISLAYHWRYYAGDAWLSIPIPLLIASLAWLAKVDARSQKKDAPDAEDDARTIKHKPRIACKVCGEGFTSTQQYAAHMRWKHHGSDKSN